MCAPAVSGDELHKIAPPLEAHFEVGDIHRLRGGVPEAGHPRDERRGVPVATVAAMFHQGFDPLAIRGERLGRMVASVS